MIGKKSVFISLLALALAVALGTTAQAQWSQDTRIDTGGDGIYKLSTDLCASDTNVYCLWIDERAPGSQDVGAIYFTYSNDWGVTWAASDQRIDLGNPTNPKVQGASVSDYPAIASSENCVYAVWEDHRLDPDPISGTQGNVYFNRSTDYGATWEDDQRIDVGVAPNDTFAAYISICASGSNVYVAWQDKRNGGSEVFFSMSPNYGAAGSWTAPQSTDPSGFLYGHGYPQLDCDGDTVYVAWQDNRNASQDIYFNSSTDGGVTWTSNTVARVDSDLPNPGNSIYLQMSAAPATGSGGGGGFPPPSTIKISPLFVGVTQAGSQKGIGHQQNPNVGGKKVYCVWRDYRNEQDAFELDIYFNYSHDGGLTWGAQDQWMNTHHASPGSVWCGYPEVAGSDKGVYVVWEDEKDDLPEHVAPYIDDVYMQASVNGGKAGSWSGPVRMDTGTTPGTVDSSYNLVAARWPYVWCCWQDERDDPVNFYDSYYCTYSINGGFTFTYSERVDSGGSNPGVGYAAIVPRGNGLHVAYRDYRNGAYYGMFYNGRLF